MKTGNKALKHASYRDRGAISRVGVYDANGVAPHVPTLRWIYTVPAGMQAIVEHAMIFQRFVTAGAPTGPVTASIQHIDVPATIRKMIHNAWDNAGAGSRFTILLGSPITLLAGESINGMTSDVSIASSHDYTLAYRAIEFYP